jgi:hypothetical protein
MTSVDAPNPSSDVADRLSIEPLDLGRIGLSLGTATVSHSASSCLTTVVKIYAGETGPQLQRTAHQTKEFAIWFRPRIREIGRRFQWFAPSAPVNRTTSETVVPRTIAISDPSADIAK